MAISISLNELDSQFKYEVASYAGGENIKVCFACGVCTGACPVSAIDPNYDPRKIIRMILLGMKERVLSSEFIWLCSLCNTCSFVCPQNVKFSEVMAVLRLLAIKQGFVHPSFPKKIEEIDRFTNTLRDKMILNIVKNRKEEISKDPKDILREVLKEL